MVGALLIHALGTGQAHTYGDRLQRTSRETSSNGSPLNH